MTYGTPCIVYFCINLINYTTEVSRVILVWGKGVHRPLDNSLSPIKQTLRVIRISTELI